MSLQNLAVVNSLQVLPKNVVLLITSDAPMTTGITCARA